MTGTICINHNKKDGMVPTAKPAIKMGLRPYSSLMLPNNDEVTKVKALLNKLEVATAVWASAEPSKQESGLSEASSMSLQLTMPS